MDQKQAPPRIDWKSVRRVLIVKLRSIGDTVLTTPSLIALRRFLPDAQIDILLEDWVAPVLKGFEGVNVISLSKDRGAKIKTALSLRQAKYDVAFNLHGGTTGTFFIRISGAKHRVGCKDYRYSFLYNHLLSSSSDFWGQEKTHSAEQQLALLGFMGVPVEDRPKTELYVTTDASQSIEKKFATEGTEITEKFALIHPVAAYDTKQWATANFARVAEYLSEKGLQAIAIATKKEREVLEKLKQLSSAPIITFDDLSLPEITALASKAKLFVGNDSGIAHIAAAVQTPSVVIFGSSNIAHWRPWTDAPNEVVYEPFDCQPCHGRYCEKFDEPKCILSVKQERVFEAIEKVVKV